MSLKEWEKEVLDAPGATNRVAEIEDELRLAAGLTAPSDRRVACNDSVGELP